MKKILMTLAAVLCCTMTTTVFTACGDDDDDNTPKSSEILGIGGIYLISVDEKMAQLCDYTMTYYANDNKLMTEKARRLRMAKPHGKKKPTVSTSLPPSA